MRGGDELGDCLATTQTVEPDRAERILGRLRRITTGGAYVPEVDGVRFIAITMVVLHHVNERLLRREGAHYVDVIFGNTNLIISTGAWGVLLFFSLSGYVLYGILSRPLLAGAPQKLKQYFLRRLTRLEPPYFLVMVGIFVFLVVTGYESTYAQSFNTGTESLPKALLASLTYSYDFIFGAFPKLNPPTWSLEVEVQFYVLAPLLTLLILRASKRAEVRFGLAVATIVAWPIVIGTQVFDNSHIANSLLRYFPYFIAGFAVAEWGRIMSERETPTWLPRVYDLTAIALFLALPEWVKLNRLWWTDIIVPITAFAIIVAALHGRWVKRFTGNRWIAVIGGMCYSIYLVHLPVLELVASKTASHGAGRPYLPYFAVQFVVLAAIVLCVAVPFYVLVERPCMRKDWPSRLLARIRDARRTDPG